MPRHEDFLKAAASLDAGIPLHQALEIPADIAEDIDAANWTAGCGLTDTTGRRERFRQLRAEAEAAESKRTQMAGINTVADITRATGYARFDDACRTADQYHDDDTVYLYNVRLRPSDRKYVIEVYTEDRGELFHGYL